MTTDEHEKTEHFTVRVPINIFLKIEDMRKAQHRSRNSIVTVALEEFVERYHAPDDELNNEELISKILEENREIKKRLEALEALEAEK